MNLTTSASNRALVLALNALAAASLNVHHAHAQGQLIYNQLGPVNLANPFFDLPSPSSAPSLDADGRVAYSRWIASFGSIHTALGNTITPAIVLNPDPSSADYRPMSFSRRSPLISNGTVYSINIDSNAAAGTRIYRNANGVVETILSPNQLLDAATGTIAAGQTNPVGTIAGQGQSLVVPLRTRTPNDPDSLNRTSLIRIDGSQTTLISTMGLTPAPGTTQQFASNALSTSVRASMDPTGRVLFSTSLAAGASGQQFAAGIWSHTLAGGITPLYLARSNTADPVPTGPLSVNAQGDIAFLSTDNNAYVYSASTGNVQPVSARAPFHPAPSSTIALNQVVLNNAGQVLSSVSLSSSPTGRAQAIVITDPTLGSRVIARSGDPLPGFSGMVQSLSVIGSSSAVDLQLFSPRLSTNSVTYFDQIALNNAGQAAFMGGGSTGLSTELNALFAYDPQGGLVTLALVGRPLPTSLPGLASSATVTQIDFIGNSNTTSGYATGLNDQGIVAFRAAFSDGSSRLITVQIPSPGALSTLALASLIVARRRRGRSL
ncbi:MAG: hypothetical protein IBJ18_00810 [Phycisphaerales bacterium]|nr:hypothetical protein [Phycisphaerales bacterium]